MSIYIDPNTGWSELLYYTNGSAISDSSYEDTHTSAATYATWFQRSWWTSNKWARKFVNLSNTPKRLVRMRFLACPGHSNGKTYSGTAGPGNLGPSIGCGCTFIVNLYSSSGASTSSASSCTLQPIDKFNCYYNGYGNTSTQNWDTSFGRLNWFGPGTGYEYDSHGHKRYIHNQTFTFTETSPVIYPGEALYIHVNPIEWSSGSTANNSLLVIESKDSDFEAVVEDTDFIWRFNGTIWEQVLSPYKFNGTEWKKQSSAKQFKNGNWTEIP